MTTVKKSGHAVTSVLPSNSDASSVAPAKIVFAQAPRNQSGGMGGPVSKKVNPTGLGPNLNK